MVRASDHQAGSIFSDAGMVLNIHDNVSLARVHDSTFQRQRRKRRLLIVGTVAIIAVVLVALNSAQGVEQEDTVKIKDPYFYEPETKINNPRSQPSPNYIAKAAPCPVYNQTNATQWDASVDWVQQGQEVTKSIHEYFKANNEHSNKFTNHFGYGNNVAISADGSRIAVSYEGKAGFDGTFGSHVEVLSFNGTAWVLEQIISDVKRGHAHSRVVHFQSLAMSDNGQRIAFSDGHGVAMFEYNVNNKDAPWEAIVPIYDPYQDQHTNVRNPSDHHHQFGNKLAMSCDGNIVAVSGRAEHYSYTKIFELEEHEGKTWIEIGEVQNIQYGGSIALSSSGHRLAIGTVASEAWRGMVQVFENKAGVWWRIGQPIVGENRLDNWGGSLSMADDGNIIAVSSKNGVINRVTVYQLRSNPDNDQLMSWQSLGQDLHGIGNAHEHFGYDVALNHDGTVLAVSAPGDDDLLQEQQNSLSGKDLVFLRGKIHMFTLDDNHWVKIDHNKLLSTADGDMFGSSIALSGDGTTVIGGAPKRTGRAFQQILGGVHVYKANLGE